MYLPPDFPSSVGSFYFLRLAPRNSDLFAISDMDMYRHLPKGVRTPLSVDPRIVKFFAPPNFLGIAKFMILAAF